MADPQFGLIQLQAKPNVLHATQAVTADDPTYEIGQSEWNAAHNAPPYVVQSIGGGASGLEWVSQPGSLTELFGDALGINRLKADLTRALQVRIVVSVLGAGAGTAVIRWQYSTNGGGAWNYLDDSAGPSAAISATGVIASSWVNLAANAKADVLLRPVGIVL